MGRWTSSVIPVREKRRLTLAAELVEAPLQLVALVLGPLRRVHLRELGRLGDLGLMLLLPLGELLRDDRVHVGVGVPRLLLAVPDLLSRLLPAVALWALGRLLRLCCALLLAIPDLLALLSCHQSHSLSPHVTALRLGLRHGAFIVVTSRTRRWASLPGDPYPQSSTMRSIASSVGWPRQRRSSSPPSSTVTVGR